MRCAIVLCAERVCVGCVWCRCAVGIGWGNVLLGASRVAVVWGLAGSCHVVSRRVASRRVVLRHGMLLTRVVDKSR